MVISKKYIPKQGDIVWLDFTPHQAGHEQAGKHPALIVCNDTFFEKTNLIIACPISSQEKRVPLHLPLPKTCKTKGYVLCEHVKSLDPIARNVEYKEKVSSIFMEKVQEYIKLFFK